MRVFSRMCNVHCLPHWRSFVPVRVSVTVMAPGFYPRSNDVSASLAAAEMRSTLTVNATDPTEEAKKIQSANRSDVSKLVEVAAATYARPGFEAADQSFTPHVYQNYSRVVTVVANHGAARSNALNWLMRGEFAPGAVSECYYEPDWDPHAPFVRKEHLAFASEMGYSLWKWILLALLLGIAGVFGCSSCSRRCSAAAVVSSVTYMHGYVTVHDRTLI